MIKPTDFPQEVWNKAATSFTFLVQSRNPEAAAKMLIFGFLAHPASQQAFDKFYSRLADLRQTLEEGYDGEAAGRLAYLQDDADNPHWEQGLYQDEQQPSALAWRDGWLAEQKEWETYRENLR